MDIKYLRLVKTIVEEGNISRSADRLFLTQSALSHQLREFEERLGAKVFIRSRNNWKLTPEGQEVYQVANDVLSRISEGLTNLTKVKEGSGGVIRLSTECYSFYHGLPLFIQKMGLLYPEIEIVLKLESGPHPASQLLSGDLDISIVTNKPLNDRLTSYELLQDEVFAVMHPEHVLAEKDFLVASDFVDQHLIIHSFPLETVAVYQHFLRPYHVEPQKITAIPMTEVTLELVEANMGIACYPKWALKPFSSLNGLRFKRLGINGLRRKHYLAIRAEDQDKKYIQDFIENILEEPFSNRY